MMQLFLNPTVLDVVLIVLLLTFITVGVFKGISHTSINLSLLVGSVMLSFTSLTNPIKVLLADKLKEWINIEKNIGANSQTKTSVALTYNLLAALILTVSFYLIFRLIKFIVYLIIRKQRGITRKNARAIHPVSRVFGGIVNLLVNGLLMILFLFALDTPVTGLNKVLDETAVSKHIVRSTGTVAEIFVDDQQTAKNILFVKTVRGDLFFEVKDDAVADLTFVNSVFEKGLVKPVEGATTLKDSKIQEFVNQTNAILDFHKNVIMDGFNVVEGFEQYDTMIKENVKNAINAASAEHNTSDDKQPYTGVENVLALISSIRAVYGTEAEPIVSSLLKLISV